MIIQKVECVSLGISVLRSLRLLRIFKVTRYEKKKILIWCTLYLLSVSCVFLARDQSISSVFFDCLDSGSLYAIWWRPSSIAFVPFSVSYFYSCCSFSFLLYLGCSSLVPSKYKCKTFLLRISFELARFFASQIFVCRIGLFFKQQQQEHQQ